MTNREFRDYLNSLHKLSYTKDEVYELGKKYREVVDKNWNWLAVELNWSSGENLRTWVKNKLTKEGKINRRGPNHDHLFNTTDDDIIVQTTVENTNDGGYADPNKQPYEVSEIDAKLSILYKEQQKYRDILNSYRRAMREDARVETLKQLIAESVDKLQDLPKLFYAPNSKQESSKIEAVLLLSDLHIGVECDNFYNKYNSKIAGERLHKLTESVVSYCRLHNVHTLNIVNLGDCIHGIIHTNARIEQEFDVVQQIMTASELLSHTLHELECAAPEVVYRSCTDNHSRAIANKQEALEEENFYKLIDWYLQERLRDSKITFVNDNIDASIGKFTLLNGKKIMFCHGHNCSINSAYQIMTGATKEFIDYICMGHYHSEKSKSYQGAKIIVNGSIVGTEQYALSKGLFSNPSQLLLIFECRNVSTISIDLS